MPKSQPYHSFLKGWGNQHGSHVINYKIQSTMKTTFMLTANDQIALYGLNTLSINSYSELSRKGYRVRCIIDKNADRLSRDDLPVVSLFDFAQIYDKKTIVIICLQNGMIHYSAASEIYQYGFRSILYLPMSFNQPIFDLQTYRRAFIHFTSGEYDRIGKVPTFQVSNDSLIVIEKNDKFVSFWCPIQYIYTPTIDKTIEACGIIPNSISDAARLCDIPLINLESYFQLYRYLSDSTQAYPDAYLLSKEFYRKINREAYLSDRKRLFDYYMKAMKFDPSFFIDSPAKCQFDMNRVYLIDGTHRACFLIFMNYSSVPIQLSKKDFNKFKKYISEEVTE